MHDFANARARGERREKNLGFFRSRGDGRAKIDGEQRGESRGLRGIAAGGQLRGEAILQQAPAGRLAIRVSGGRAERGPKLDEGAEDGRFGDLASENLANLNCSFFAFAVQGLPRADDDGRGAARRGGLPLTVAADRRDPRKHIGRDQEVRLLGERAQQIERNGAALVDEARGKFGGQGNGGRKRGDAGRTLAGFGQRWRRRGNLRMTREKQAQTDVLEPLGGVFECQQTRSRSGCGGLVPQRGTRDL